MVCATCELHVGTHQGVPYSIGLRTQLSGQGFLKRMGAEEREGSSMEEQPALGALWAPRLPLCFPPNLRPGSW